MVKPSVNGGGLHHDLRPSTAPWRDGPERHHRRGTAALAKFCAAPTSLSTRQPARSPGTGPGPGRRNRWPARGRAWPRVLDTGETWILRVQENGVPVEMKHYPVEFNERVAVSSSAWTRKASCTAPAASASAILRRRDAHSPSVRSMVQGSGLSLASPRVVIKAAPPRKGSMRSTRWTIGSPPGCVHCSGGRKAMTVPGLAPRARTGTVMTRAPLRGCRSRCGPTRQPELQPPSGRRRREHAADSCTTGSPPAPSADCLGKGGGRSDTFFAGANGASVHPDRQPRRCPHHRQRPCPDRRLPPGVPLAR